MSHFHFSSVVFCLDNGSKCYENLKSTTISHAYFFGGFDFTGSTILVVYSMARNQASKKYTIFINLEQQQRQTHVELFMFS